MSDLVQIADGRQQPVCKSVHITTIGEADICGVERQELCGDKRHVQKEQESHGFLPISRSNHLAPVLAFSANSTAESLSQITFPPARWVAG